MRKALAALAILGLLPLAGGIAAGKPPVTFGWQKQGFAALVPAAAQARSESRRLLLGLSGGET